MLPEGLRGEQYFRGIMGGEICWCPLKAHPRKFSTDRRVNLWVWDYFCQRALLLALRPWVDGYLGGMVTLVGGGVDALPCYAKGGTLTVLFKPVYFISSHGPILLTDSHLHTILFYFLS